MNDISFGWLAFWLSIALALASVSLRAALELPPPARWRRLALLLATSALGILLTRAITDDPAGWPAGFVVGLAVVEVGPAIATAMRTLIRRKGDDL